MVDAFANTTVGKEALEKTSEAPGARLADPAPAIDSANKTPKATGDIPTPKQAADAAVETQGQSEVLSSVQEANNEQGKT